MVQHSYSYKLYIDDLPSATVSRSFNDHTQVDYFEGIPLGLYSTQSDMVIIFNHLNITIYTHTTIEGYERIVGFEVQPMSLGEDENRMLYDPTKSDIQLLVAGEPFRFSYRIRTVVSAELI